MTDIMIDIESYGVKPGCVIRSVGAIVFDPKTGHLGAEFYANVDRTSCELLGLVVDPNTEQWWKRQSLAAQAALAVDPKPLDDVLFSFSAWWSTNGGERIWSHGANFDQPIMEAAYEKVGMQAPWSFWNSRCTRTLYDVAGVDTRKMSAGEVKHNALDDARIQARAAHMCFQRLGLAAPSLGIVPAAPISEGVFN